MAVVAPVNALTYADATMTAPRKPPQSTWLHACILAATTCPYRLPTSTSAAIHQSKKQCVSIEFAAL